MLGPNADDFNNLATKFSFYREFSSQFLQTSIVSQHTKAKLNGNLVSTKSWYVHKRGERRHSIKFYAQLATQKGPRIESRKEIEKKIFSKKQQ